MRSWTLVWAAAVLLANAATVTAQDAGSVGVTMGYPGALGVVWQITDRLAVRPDVTLGRTSSESTTSAGSVLPGVDLSSTTTSDGWNTTLGLSALVTVKTIDRLRLYLTPRVGWSRSSARNETGVSGDRNDFDITTDGVVAAASLGAQQALGDHFAVFGELGLQYSRLETTSDYPGSRNRTIGHTTGLRSAVGVTLYF